MAKRLVQGPPGRGRRGSLMAAVSVWSSRAETRGPRGARCRRGSRSRRLGWWCSGACAWYSGVGHVVDPGRAARPPARAGVNSSSRQAPVTSRSAPCQPALANIPLQPDGRDRGHDPVKRLPVQVNHPDEPRQARRPAGIADRLPHRAPRPARRHDEQRVTGGRWPAPPKRCLGCTGGLIAPQTGRFAPMPHRAGGVVDRIGVLRPARVALQAAEGAQRRQVLFLAARRAGS